MLVVDDSAVVRQRLKSIIETDPRFRVILAADPYEAVAMLAKSIPGVIVLDVEMPRMDGLTFLKKLMRQHPLPVVLCTSIADRALTALEMGALEVIAKPDWRDPAKLASWADDFMESVRNAAGASRLPPRDGRATAPDTQQAADLILPAIRTSRAAHRASRLLPLASVPAAYRQCRWCSEGSARKRRGL